MLSYYGRMDVAKLAVVSSLETGIDAAELMLAKAVLKAAQTGDPKQVETVLNRLIGKPAEADTNLYQDEDLKQLDKYTPEQIAQRLKQSYQL